MNRIFLLVGFVLTLSLFSSCNGKAPANNQASTSPLPVVANLPSDGVIVSLPIIASFGAKDGMVPLLKPQGLAAPEEWGSWSSAKEVTLQFSFSNPIPGAATITLEYHALANAQHPQNFSFLWNGNRLGDQTVKDMDVIRSSYDISGEIAKTNILTIKVPDAITPKALGIGGDLRNLGIALHSIEFMAR